MLPPAKFWAHASAELALLIEDEELWIFVQLGADERDAFAEDSSDLLVQLKTVHQLSIGILALTDRQTNAVRFGLAVSNELMLQAVRFGLAPDAQRLVAVLERNFSQTLSAASVHGLSDSQIQAIHKGLARLRQMHGTSTAPELSCNMEY